MALWAVLVAYLVLAVVVGIVADRYGQRRVRPPGRHRATRGARRRGR